MRVLFETVIQKLSLLLYVKSIIYNTYIETLQVALLLEEIL